MTVQDTNEDVTKNSNPFQIIVVFRSVVGTGLTRKTRLPRKRMTCRSVVKYRGPPQNVHSSTALENITLRE